MGGQNGWPSPNLTQGSKVICVSDAERPLLTLRLAVGTLWRNPLDSSNSRVLYRFRCTSEHHGGKGFKALR